MSTEQVKKGSIWWLVSYLIICGGLNVLVLLFFLLGVGLGAKRSNFFNNVVEPGILQVYGSMVMLSIVLLICALRRWQTSRWSRNVFILGGILITSLILLDRSFILAGFVAGATVLSVWRPSEKLWKIFTIAGILLIVFAPICKIIWFISLNFYYSKHTLSYYCVLPGLTAMLVSSVFGWVVYRLIKV